MHTRRGRVCVVSICHVACMLLSNKTCQHPRFCAAKISVFDHSSQNLAVRL